MKYLNHEQLGIVIFGEAVTHARMAATLGGRVLSAGFVNMETCRCYGKSVSLGLNADEKDSDLLRACVAV